VNFAAITFCVASKRVFVVVDFAIDSVRKLLDTLSYTASVADMTLKCPTEWNLQFDSDQMCPC